MDEKSRSVGKLLRNVNQTEGTKVIPFGPLSVIIRTKKASLLLANAVQLFPETCCLSLEVCDPTETISPL